MRWPWAQMLVLFCFLSPLIIFPVTPIFKLDIRHRFGDSMHILWSYMHLGLDSDWTVCSPHVWASDLTPLSLLHLQMEMMVRIPNPQCCFKD